MSNKALVSMTVKREVVENLRGTADFILDNIKYRAMSGQWNRGGKWLAALDISLRIVCRNHTLVDGQNEYLTQQQADTLRWAKTKLLENMSA